MIKGFSTAPGTEAYSKRFSDISFSRLGRTNLTVSLGGFGCYRVDRSVEDHFTAMSLALKSGVNLIDTSSNYSDGASEELVGAVLTSLIESGDLRREEVVVITKAGYLQGGNLRVKQQREAEGKPFPDLVPYDLNLEHCIHPDFLEDQINRSLNRLSLQSVDVFLLHNPEYYLGWANKQGIPLKDARDEYHSRIDSAFRYLEWEIADGRIKSYGISSNSFPATPEDYQFTSLEKIWTIAEAISPSHSFKVIQFPMNLFERQAITAINQSENRSLIDFARHTDLGTLINRPLNAFVNNKLIRLASVEQPDPIREDKLIKYLDDLMASEKTFRDSLIFSLPLDDRIRAQLIDFLCPANTLSQHWKNFANYTQWYQVLTQHYSPQFDQAVDYLQNLDLPIPLSYWLDNHIDQLQRVIRAIDSFYKLEASETASKIMDIVSATDKDWRDASNLSRTAFRALSSTLGVSSVLVGMRQEAYLRDILTELRVKTEQKDRKSSWMDLDQDLKASRF